MRKIYILLLTCLVSAVSYAGGFKGDLNGDGTLDLTDFGILARAIKEGSAEKQYDINSSGTVNDADLQRLATMIIKRTLVEDTGLNAGIGDWKDDGTDYGGTLSRSAEELEFYFSGVRAETLSGGYSIEFGLNDYPGDVSAILFNIILPMLEFNPAKIVELSDDLMIDHKLYGTPAVDDWEGYRKVVRFIIASPDMRPFPQSARALGRIYYDTVGAEGGVVFSECQFLSPGSVNAETLTERYSDWIRWYEVDGIADVAHDSVAVGVEGGYIRVTAPLQSAVAVYDAAGSLMYSGNGRTVPVEKNRLYIVVVDGKAHKVRS